MVVRAVEMIRNDKGDNLEWFADSFRVMLGHMVLLVLKWGPGRDNNWNFHRVAPG